MSGSTESDVAFHFPHRCRSTCTSTWSCWSVCTWCQLCFWKSPTWPPMSSTPAAGWSASSSTTSSGWERDSHCSVCNMSPQLFTAGCLLIIETRENNCCPPFVLQDPQRAWGSMWWQPARPWRWETGVPATHSSSMRRWTVRSGTCFLRHSEYERCLSGSCKMFLSLKSVLSSSCCD